MGGRKPTVEDEVILRLIALAPWPVVTAPDLAEKLGMTQQGAYSRLKQFENSGLVRSKLVGANARVWWLTDEGKEIVAEEFFKNA